MSFGGFLLVVLAMCSMSVDESRYGIARFVKLSSWPDANCIRDVLNSVGDIRRLEALDPPTRAGLQRFRYEGDGGAWAYLTIRVDSEGQTQCLHERLTINEKPSENELRKTYGLMMTVERQLVSRCAIKELAMDVQEEWIGVSRPQ